MSRSRRASSRWSRFSCPRKRMRIERTPRDFPPVQIAVVDDRLAIAGLLLKHGCAAPDILTAALGGKTAVVESLLKTDRTLIRAVTKQKWTALHLAAAAGRIEVVKILLREGLEVDAKADGGLVPLQ